MPLPPMTPEQRQRALAKAAAARSARSALLADVKAGTVRPEQVFDRADDVAKKTRVAQVLRSLPGYGRPRSPRRWRPPGSTRSGASAG